MPVRVPYPVYSTPEPYHASKPKKRKYVPTPTPGPFYMSTPISKHTTPYSYSQAEDDPSSAYFLQSTPVPQLSNPYARNLPDLNEYSHNQHLNTVRAVPSHPTTLPSYHKNHPTPIPKNTYHPTPLLTYQHHSTPQPNLGDHPTSLPTLPHPSTVRSLPSSSAHLDSHRSSLVDRFNSQLKREIKFDRFDATPTEENTKSESRMKREGDPNSAPSSESEPQFSNVLPSSISINNQGVFSNTLSGSVGGLFGLSSNSGGSQASQLTSPISGSSLPLSGLSDSALEHVLGGTVDLEGIRTRTLGGSIIPSLEAGVSNNESVRQAVVELLARDPQLVAALNNLSGTDRNQGMFPNLDLGENSGTVSPAGTFWGSILFPTPTTPIPSLHQHHEPLGGVLRGGELHHDPRTVLADVSGHHIHPLTPISSDHNLLPLPTIHPEVNPHLHSNRMIHPDMHYNSHLYNDHKEHHHDKAHYISESDLLLHEHQGGHGHKDHSVTHHELPAPPGCRSVVTKECRKVNIKNCQYLL